MSTDATDTAKLAMALAAAGDHAGAAEQFRACVRLAPGWADGWRNLGVALSRTGDWAGAADCHERGVALAPADADGWYALGAARHWLGDPAAAEACQRRAVGLRPGFAAACQALGVSLLLQGRWREGLALYEHRRSASPGHAVAGPPGATAWDGAADLAGRHLLLLPEGGLGNTVQFYRLAAALAARHPAARVTVRCDPVLAGVGGGLREPGRGEPRPSGSGARVPACSDGTPSDSPAAEQRDSGRVRPEYAGTRAPLADARGSHEGSSTFPLPDGRGSFSVVPTSEPLIGPFDFFAPLPSLPHLMGVDPDAGVPGPMPFLAADPVRAADVRRRLDALVPPVDADGRPVRRVGVCWACAPNPWGRDRSFPPEMLRPLSAVPGVRLVSIQQGTHAPPPPADVPVVDVGLPRLGAAGATPADVLADTLALIATLDLIVTPDTLAAHLAGGLGVPAWVASSTPADWRWTAGGGPNGTGPAGRWRERSPWYPSVRLFRQRRPGDWAGVFEAMAEGLRKDEG